jgi:general secretion pathway protein C
MSLHRSHVQLIALLLLASCATPRTTGVVEARSVPAREEPKAFEAEPARGSSVEEELPECRSDFDCTEDAILRRFGITRADDPSAPPGETEHNRTRLSRMDLERQWRDRDRPTPSLACKARRCVLRLPRAEVIAKVLGGIEPTTAQRWSVTRRAMDLMFDSINDVARTVRGLPSYRLGVHEGFKIVGVDPDGIFAKLGFEVGDVVLRVNSIGLDSPESLLRAFRGLKKSSRVTVELRRQKARHTLEYTIR